MGTAVYCCKTRLDNYKSNEIKCVVYGEKNFEESIYTDISKNVTDNSDCYKANSMHFNISNKVIRIQKKVREFLNNLHRKKLLGSFFSNINSYQTPKLGINIDQGIIDNNLIIHNSINFRYIGENSKNKTVFGIMLHKNGTKYIGYWKDNKESGLGVLKSINGNVYKGEFLNGKQQGYGYLLQLNGKIYEGTFEEDLQNGIGTEKSYNKSNYSGEYKKGKKEGIGKWLGNDGSVYEGEFYDNLKHGYGILTFKDGSIYKGQWYKNTMEGFGEFFQFDGKIYVGFHKNDKRHGLGFFVWVDGRTFIGNWKNGKQHGLGKYIVEGVAKYGIWIDGERISWYNSEEEAFNQIKIEDEYEFFYKFDNEDIKKFLYQDTK